MTIYEALADVDHIVDALGMPVDEGVKRIVAALHVHDIPTTASCEGHLKQGEAYPWVAIGFDVGPPEYSDSVEDSQIMGVARRLEAIEKESDNLEIFATLYRTDTDVRYGTNITDEGLKIRRLDDDLDEDKLRRENYAVGAKVTDLLAGFYKAHPQPEYRLVLAIQPQGWFGDVSLINNGVAGSFMLSAEDKAKSLKAFQAEMNRFADYLFEVA